MIYYLYSRDLAFSFYFFLNRGPETLSYYLAVLCKNYETLITEARPCEMVLFPQTHTDTTNR